MSVCVIIDIITGRISVVVVAGGGSEASGAICGRRESVCVVKIGIKVFGAVGWRIV